MTTRRIDHPRWKVKDGKVVHGGALLRSADPDSFEPLAGTWSWDSKRVFFDGSEVKLIDRTTFRCLNTIYGADSARVYVCGFPLKGADPASFQVLDSGAYSYSYEVFGNSSSRGGFAHDDTSVFYLNRRVRDAIPESFVSLADYFGRDSTHVFHENQSLKNVDLTTWRRLVWHYSVDATTVYFQHRPTKIDRPTVTMLPVPQYLRDKERYYCNGVPAQESDFVSALKQHVDHLTQTLNDISSGRFDEIFSNLNPQYE